MLMFCFFSVLIALQICSCMLSDPVHLDPPDRRTLPPPHPKKAGSTSALLLIYRLLLVPVVPSSTHLQMPCPLQSVSHVFCTALCVCHVHSVDTSLRSPFSPSHICIVSLCDLDLPPFSALLSFLWLDIQVADAFPQPPKKLAVLFAPSCRFQFPWLNSSWSGLVRNQHCMTWDETHLIKWNNVLLLEPNREHLQRFHHLSEGQAWKAPFKVLKMSRTPPKYTASSDGCRQPVSLFLICMISSQHPLPLSHYSIVLLVVFFYIHIY